MELNGERFWSFVHSIQSPADILSGTVSLKTFFK